MVRLRCGILAADNRQLPRERKRIRREADRRFAAPFLRALRVFVVTKDGEPEGGSIMETVRVVCAHDCPDMCSLLAEVENGRVLRVRGDPEQPFTAGFACAKVNRDADLVHSPERIQTPLRRIGAKGEGRFAPISWDEALDEITGRWKRIIAESGPLALLGYAYSAHQGQMNRGLMLGLFHALGASRLIAGTVCDTCCEEAWNLTVGPVGGADPEAVEDSDLIVAWGADLVATNVHFWAKAEAARRRGVKIVVDRSAQEPHRAAG